MNIGSYIKSEYQLISQGKSMKLRTEKIQRNIYRSFCRQYSATQGHAFCRIPSLCAQLHPSLHRSSQMPILYITNTQIILIKVVLQSEVKRGEGQYIDCNVDGLHLHVVLHIGTLDDDFLSSVDRRCSGGGLPIVVG